MMRLPKALLLMLAALVASPIHAQQPQPLGPTVTTRPAAAQATTPAAMPATPGAVPQLTKADVDAWLDGYLPYALAKADIAGAVVVVVKDGQVLTERGFGYANVEKRTPVDPERTLFRPGSASKLYTWTAVMQLVEQGKLDLDADVNRYLDFKIPPRDGKPVTLRNIMTHTAGFEEQVKSIIGFKREDVPAYVALLKRWIPERIFAPGTTPAYSNYATALAGYIVQRVSGEDYYSYIEHHIFQPLGMEHSTFRQPVPDSFKPFLATGYKVASGEPVDYEYVGPAPAGSLATTGADMAKFMIAHLADGRGLLQPQTARMMHTTALTILPNIQRMVLGFYETDINGHKVIAHGGDTVAFHSDVHLFLNDNVGIFISMSSPGKEGAAGDIRKYLFEGFADRYFPAPAITTRVPEKEAAEHARMMAGSWVSSRRSDSSFLNITELLGQAKVGVDAKGKLIAPVTLGLNGQPRRWVEVAPFVWDDLDSHERLVAKLENGRPVRFSVSTVSPFTVFDRAPWYKDGAWLAPLAGLSLLLLTGAVLFWPVRAMVRRGYGASLGLDARSHGARKAAHIMALLIVLVMAGWAAAVTSMFSNLALLNSGFDMIILALEALSNVVLVGGFLVMLWVASVVWTSRRHWTVKLWSLLMVLSAGTLLWVGVAFHLLRFGTNY